MKRQRPDQHGRDHFDGGTDPLEGKWYAVQPTSPADVGDELLLEGPDFENDWGNIADYAATAFKKALGGTRIRMSVTGGEGDPGSTIFTLPSGYQPQAKYRLFAQIGVDGSGIGTIEVNTDGTVVFVGQIGS
jgi:hypothetical protein